MRLNIKSVSQSDFGSYRCVAKNSLGDTDGTIKLYSELLHSSCLKCFDFVQLCLFHRNSQRRNESSRLPWRAEEKQGWVEWECREGKLGEWGGKGSKCFDWSLNKHTIARHLVEVFLCFSWKLKVLTSYDFELSRNLIETRRKREVTLNWKFSMNY